MICNHHYYYHRRRHPVYVYALLDVIVVVLKSRQHICTFATHVPSVIILYDNTEVP